jgi:hypothetical protein
MNSRVQLTGRLVAAGRALASIGQEDFSAIVGLPAETLNLIEANGSAWIQSEEHVRMISWGLDQIGIVVIEEADGMGAGVRLKFTRQDVKQVMRLENEGGNVACDDAP